MSSGGEVETVALGPPREADDVARGRSLFFDARLSHDGWMSCHSCHSEAHTSGLLADTLGDDTRGTPKRILSLRGVGETAPYAWNGSQPSLEQQIEKSLRTTMHAETVEPASVADLVAYLSSLPAPSPVASASNEVRRGRQLFRSLGCVDCHVPPLFTSTGVYDVGLRDEAGHSAFNPPSLRGVGLRTRLFHDGRYRRLEELLSGAGHPGTQFLPASDVAAVAAFLRSL